MFRVLMLTGASLLLVSCGGGTRIASSVPSGTAAYQLFPVAASSHTSADYRLGPLDT